MTEQQLPPDSTSQPADDHFLEDLAAATGLFNPEQIWQTELQLDKMEEDETPPAGESELTE